MPVGTPVSRSGPTSMPTHHQGDPANVPGGLSIAGVPPPPKDGAEQHEAEPEDTSANPERGSRKRCRASSSAGANSSPASRNNTSPTMPVPGGAPPAQQPNTSPNSRPGAIPPLTGQPPALQIPAGTQPLPLDAHSPRQGQAQPTSPNYAHANPYPPQDQMYGAPQHQQPQHGGYQQQPPQYGFGHEGAPGQQGGLAAGHPGTWGAPPVQQGSHYTRR